MYGFLYLDVLCVHNEILKRINICMGCIACSYSNRKENKHMYGFLHFDVLRVRTAIICMASFIWMYCMFIQEL